MSSFLIVILIFMSHGSDIILSQSGPFSSKFSYLSEELPENFVYHLWHICISIVSPVLCFCVPYMSLLSALAEVCLISSSFQEPNLDFI